ncbi:HAD family hydrolase [Candidatus Nomurabacteria bacterium]|nr:HAD family hydrolase [Candidatus Nomurabacteria bacterium]
MKNSTIEYQKKLVLASFSQTIAKTEMDNLFQQAYHNSINLMFGYEGLVRFLNEGGAKGRSSIEVVMHLASIKELLPNLEEYCENYDIDLSLDSTLDPTPEIYKAFININIYYLNYNIGTICTNGNVWPEIYTGFREFRDTLESHNVDFGIISSGYEKFIREVFNYHSIKQPLLYITPDDSFGPYNLDWKSKNKPSVYLIALAIDQWLQYNPQIDMDYARQNVILIGDDIEPDGKMAENAGIPFWFFNQDTNIVLNNNQRIFSNYGQLTNALKDGKLFY